MIGPAVIAALCAVIVIALFFDNVSRVRGHGPLLKSARRISAGDDDWGGHYIILGGIALMVGLGFMLLFALI